MKKLFLTGCLSILLWGAATARNLVPEGTLERYIAQGLRENLALTQESIEISQVTESLNQARSLFFPRVSFNPTYSLASGGRRLEFPVGDMLNPAYRTLNQLTGSDKFPTNISNLSEQLTPNNFHDTRLVFSHTLFNSDIRYNYLIQKDLLSAQQARKRIVENELRYHITAAYYQYLQALDAVSIYESARNILKVLLSFNQKLVSNNSATLEVVTSAKYEISKTDQQLADAIKNRETSKAYFNFLLNRELTMPVEVDSAWVTEPEFTTEAQEGLFQQALSMRPELTQLQKSLHAAKTSVRMNESSATLPTLYLGGSTGFQGFGYTFKKQAYVAMQLGLKWDLFTAKEKHSKIQQAKIRTLAIQTQLTETEKQIQLQVLMAYQELIAARESLTAAQSGIQNAKQAFKIIDSKYKNGQALLIEFLRYQNDEFTARYQYSLARTEVHLRQAALDRAVAVE